MSRLSSISASPTLKEFAQGAAQESIMPVADFLAPTVAVPTSTGRFKKYTEKNRFHIPNTLRTLGGRATELRFYGHALEEGVYLHHGWHHGISAAHTDDDLDQALERLERAARRTNA